MYNSFQLAIKYIKYLLTAQSGKGHGIHSPFVFDLVTQVLNDKGKYYCYEPIESLRQVISGSNATIKIVDLGAGSRKANARYRNVKEIAKNALKPPKYSSLLFRLANFCRSKHILELGTSLGITTAYLASTNHVAKVITLEGVPDIAKLARVHFEMLRLENITIVEGNFDTTLPGVISKAGLLDFVYIDGNHRLEPTLRYFDLIFPYLLEGSVVVFDDIHWSAEMEQAWTQIKADNRVQLTIDLFFIGIVFFNTDIKNKQDFVIRF